MHRKIALLQKKTPKFATARTGLRVNATAFSLSRFYSKPSSQAQLSQTSGGRSTINSSWSSPQDRVVRNVFGNDYVHAWTLLEACLYHGNMERAESVLMGLTEISGAGDITLAVNLYLQRLIEVNVNRPYVPTDWLRMLEYRVPRFRSNDATEALMLRNAAENSDRFPDLLPERVAKLHKTQLRSVLRQVELLGVDIIKKIMAAGGLELGDVDGVTKAALANARSIKEDSVDELQNTDTESDVWSNDKEHKSSPASNATQLSIAEIKRLQKPIKKEGYDDLTPTQSFGLVAVRHVLSGLQLKGKSDREAINELAKLAGMPHLKNRDEALEPRSDAPNFDFFEIYKNLNTDEERQKFDEVLQSINERRQKHIESRGLEAARMRWRQMFEQMVEADKSGQGKVQLKGLETLLWQWNQAMMPHIEFEMNRMKILAEFKTKAEITEEFMKTYFPDLKKKDVVTRYEYAPYFCLAKAENLPAMTMMELLRLNTNSREHNNKSATAMVSVGKNVEREYKLDLRRRLRKTKPVSAQQLSNKDSEKTDGKITQDLVTNPPLVSMSHSWPPTIRAKIGSFLISIFMQVAKVPVSGIDPVSGKRVKGKSPAFHHTYQYLNGTKVGVLRPHNVVANYLSGEKVSLQPQQLPMLCKPRPWTSWNSGGYWYTPSTIIRSKDCPEQIAYIAAASERGQMQSVFRGLNALGETAWTVNKDMLKILTQIWNSKEAFLDIPPHVNSQPDLSHLTPPDRDSDPGVLRDYRRLCRRLVLENGALYSQRCDLNYKLDIARAMLGERFYMPHNLDFRGRAYPLSPHFNHMGNDVSRSLLIFWEGKKLGPRGMHWLKVHLANLFGINKSSHAERVAFTEEHMEDVLSSARRPLEPEGSWWKQAESPFQALAACIEIKNALEHPDGAENYESHFTVHQDGSCNGLQHYAALGGDFEGAYQVNLQAADRPQDVYSRVCEIVKEKVLSETTPEFAETAKLVGPLLTRKVVKQTVMTHVYGVTYAGARDQVANRLKEIEGFPADKVFNCASYVAQKVLNAVRELFTSAHEIQDWLGNNASKISRAITLDPSLHGADSKFVSSVIWTTPLGLPIVQPYRVVKSKQVNTELQTVFISDPYSFRSVNPRKQKTAFPPNYIHSLDASHMLMSALRCADDGITFASVHDSFWTHAADIDTMNKNLRECFVELHSDNLIEKLKVEFQTRYGTLYEVVEIPATSPPAVKIKKIWDEYSRKRFGRATKLDLPAQIDLELNAVENEETPLKILASLSPEEIETYIQEESVKRRPKPTKSTYNMQQSKEFEGFGVDKLQEMAEIEDLAQASDEDDQPIEKKSKRGTANGGIKVIVPLRVPPVPSRGKFDVRNVLTSPYFFS